MDVITTALIVALGGVVIAAGSLALALRRQRPLPPGHPGAPAQPSGPFGWHIAWEVKAWFGLLTFCVLALIGVFGVWVVDVAGETTMVDIISHRPGDVVAQHELVRGTIKDLPCNCQVWLVIAPHGREEYYPQPQVWRVDPTGDWSTNALIGGVDDSGVAFDLLAVLANPAANDVLLAHMAEPDLDAPGPALESLPDGAKVYDRISVIRG